MSVTIARTGALAPHQLRARALRAVAIAVLAVGLQVPVTVAAAGDSSDDSISLAFRGPIAATVAADGAGSESVPVQADDGEDHFDQGDDEFNCDNVNEGEDPCEDNPEDRLDAGDDEYGTGCANFDDGEDRCLDDGERRVDQPVPTHATTDAAADQPVPTQATTDAAAAAASPSPALGLAGLASLITLGAGSLWFLRRGHR